MQQRRAVTYERTGAGIDALPRPFALPLGGDAKILLPVMVVLVTKHVASVTGRLADGRQIARSVLRVEFAVRLQPQLVYAGTRCGRGSTIAYCTRRHRYERDP